MRVLLSDAALDDLASVYEFLAKDVESKALERIMRLLDAAESLAELPSLGRPGRVPGTRELIVPGTPYIIPYRVKGETVQVLRFYHSSRRWPKRL